MKKAIGILYSMNGLSMLIIWPILIIKNQVPELETNLSYMCFHFIAELITAISTLIVGIGFLINKKWANKYYFVATGLFFGAGYLAIGYYIFSDLTNVLTMIIMLFALNITGLTLFLIIYLKGLLIQAKNFIKLSLFFNGIIIYTLINVAGFLSERETGYTNGYISMIFIIVIYTIWTIYSKLKNITA